MCVDREKAARANAIANVRLEGYNVTPEFVQTMELYWDNKITMLQAFERQGIDTSVIPEGAKKRLRKKVNDDR